jgi:tetratricopeptide (TPR) repeat protein
MFLALFAPVAAAPVCESGRDLRLAATAAYANHDLAQAIAKLRVAIQACPEEPFYRFMLGNALYRAGALADAAASYEAFLEQRSGDIEAHISLGFAAYELGDHSKAVREWTAAVRLEPESPLAHAALAAGLFAAGDEQNAAVQCRLAQTLDPRYSRPEELAVDIRWKPQVREVLHLVLRLVESQEGGSENVP